MGGASERTEKCARAHSEEMYWGNIVGNVEREAAVSWAVDGTRENEAYSLNKKFCSWRSVIGGGVEA